MRRGSVYGVYTDTPVTGLAGRRSLLNEEESEWKRVDYLLNAEGSVHLNPLNIP